MGPNPDPNPNSPNPNPNPNPNPTPNPNPNSVRCTNARAVLAGLEAFGPTKRKLNNGVLLAAPNASFLAAWRRD